MDIHLKNLPKNFIATFMKTNFEYIIKETGGTSFSKPPRVLVTTCFGKPPRVLVTTCFGKLPRVLVTAIKRVNHVIKNLQAQNTIKQTSFLRFMFIANS